jgi:hypothetical protein
MNCRLTGVPAFAASEHEHIAMKTISTQSFKTV